GSGKTRVLTERAAALARQQGAEAVLAITFTNRAAQELRTRLAALLGQGAGEQMTVGTFHAICHRMLRRHARRAGRTPAFSVYDAQASRKLLAQALDEEGAGAELPVSLCQHQLGQARARLLTPQGYLKLGGGERVRLIAGAWERYLRALEESDALDFDELLVRAVGLLAEPDLLARYQSAFGAVLVDEYQDTNHAQHEWLRRLCQGHRNLTAVGDEDQAVYGWRGAEVEHVRHFERDYPGARVICLERNYRSSGAIVRAGALLVAHNERRSEKTMWTRAPAGLAVALIACADEADEANQAAVWCRALIEAGIEAGEIAVLFRTRAQARVLEDALLFAGVPCRVIGGQG
ncbi:MAG: UvrD-helicase domain-containing protein, partial [Actinobacteria bacterium]|nr:UvrD-helicase domain-containing protein [Actinomycetota bacterium]